MKNPMYHEHCLRERNDSWYVAFSEKSIWANGPSLVCYYENRHFGKYESYGLVFEGRNKDKELDDVYSVPFRPTYSFVRKVNTEFNHLPVISNSEHTPIFYLVHWILLKDKKVKMRFGFEDDLDQLLKIIEELIDHESNWLKEQYDMVVKQIDCMYEEDNERPIIDFDNLLEPLITSVVYCYVQNQLNKMNGEQK